MSLIRKFSQVAASLDIEGEYEDGKIERLEHQLTILKNVVIVLVGLLERKDILSIEDAQFMSRIRYSSDLDELGQE